MCLSFPLIVLLIWPSASDGRCSSSGRDISIYKCSSMAQLSFSLRWVCYAFLLPPSTYITLLPIEFFVFNMEILLLYHQTPKSEWENGIKRQVLFEWTQKKERESKKSIRSSLVISLPWNFWRPLLGITNCFPLSDES